MILREYDQPRDFSVSASFKVKLLCVKCPRSTNYCTGAAFSLGPIGLSEVFF